MSIKLGNTALSKAYFGSNQINKLYLGNTLVFGESVKAFPTAYGAGAYATGGRGKTVYVVDNLNDSGTGSFRQALEDTRTTDGGIITFSVSGTIVLTTKLDFRNQDNITIAGQTAPDGGITIVGSNDVARFELVNVNNFIMRYIRFRPDYTAYPTTEIDSFYLYNCGNYIIDHCSFSFGTDENADAGIGDTYTWQRNLFADSNKTGMIMGADVALSANQSFHNNMFYNCSHRFPNYQSDGRVDVINNVIWNYRTRISVSQGGHDLNHIGNYYQYFRDDPPADEARWNLWYPFNQTLGDGTISEYPTIYTSGNYISNVLTDLNADNYVTWRWRLDPVGSPYAGAAANSQLTTDFKTTTQFPLLGSQVVVQTALEALEDVKFNVGANGRLDEDGLAIAEIDDLDTIYLSNTQNSIRVDYTPETNLATAQWTAFQASVSTTPINSHGAGYDTSGDGMPDAWKTAKGLNPATDDSLYDWGNGYIGCEEFLNEIDDFIPPLQTELYTKSDVVSLEPNETNSLGDIIEVGAGTLSIVTGSGATGSSSYYAKLIGSNAGSERIEIYWSGLVIGNDYTFSAYLKKVNNSCELNSWTNVTALDGGVADPKIGGGTEFISDEVWTKYSYPLRVTATSGTCRFYVGSLNDSEVHVDSFSITLLADNS